MARTQNCTFSTNLAIKQKDPCELCYNVSHFYEANCDALLNYKVSYTLLNCIFPKFIFENVTNN